jgi:uncharacterized protein (TIGR03790 family)
MPRIFLASIVVAVCLVAIPAGAQTAASVLVVANEAVSGSMEIAQRYVAARNVPAEQLVRVKTAITPQIARRNFEVEIETPIASWLNSHSAQDRILYIVLTRGIPVRILGSAGRDGTGSSVDSELALLYRRMTGVFTPLNGPLPNPYFAANGDALKPFSHAAQDIYLVTRLDGFTVEDAMALVGRGTAPSREGRILLDEPKSGDVRSTWLAAAAKRLEDRGFAQRVVHDTTARALSDQTGVLGYSSWGSNDPALEVRHPDLNFVPGALASMFLSSDARTFAEPPAAWTPGRTHPQDYAGSSQSLIGDLVRAGATGIAGHVSEPYLDGSIRPDVLFPAYVSGLNLAESYYLAMPYLSWQSVVVGDPLCAPFRTAAIVPDNIDPPLDKETELPSLFSARRLATSVGRRGSDPAAKLILRAEARLAHADSAGAADALKQALAIDATSVAAWRALGVAFDAQHNDREAAAAYEHALKLDRNDVASLNNLAYIFAVRDKRPADALPLAMRALALDGRNGLVQDTLGWIHHLLGDDQQAAKFLAAARRAEPGHAEIQFHAAVVLDLVGRRDEAAKALEAADALDPTLKERADFRELQRKLTGDGQSKE